MFNTNTFENRYNLGDLLSNSINKLFDSNEIELIPFGFENLFYDKTNLKSFIDSKIANLSHAAMLVKFLPDFILFKKSEPQSIYFLEIKVYATPLWASKNLEEIRRIHGDINISDIGLIAREAWNAYRTLFPNTIIVSATTYNPYILKAQFVDKIECLRCNGKDGMVDCSKCPVKGHSFFENSRNYNSTGSQTQHTNINLSSFLSFKDFFDQLSININEDKLNTLINTIKAKGIIFPLNIYDSVKNKIITTLINEGCTWLK